LGLRYKNFLIGPYFINGLNIGKKPTNVDLKPIDYPQNRDPSSLTDC